MRYVLRENSKYLGNNKSGIENGPKVFLSNNNGKLAKAMKLIHFVEKLRKHLWLG